MYDDLDAAKLNDVCEFIGVLSRVPSLAAAQLEAHSVDGPGGESDDDGGSPLGDEQAHNEALAMPPTSLVRMLLFWCPASLMPWSLSGSPNQRKSAVRYVP